MKKKYTKEILIKKLQDKARELGRTPTKEDLKLPGIQTYGNYFGSWSKALKQAQLISIYEEARQRNAMINQAILEKKQKREEQYQIIIKEINALNRKLNTEEKRIYIYKFKEKGFSLSEIALVFGCSKERIRQIAGNKKSSEEDILERKRKRNEAKKKGKKKKLIENLRKLYQENDKLYNITQYKEFAICVKYFGSWENALIEAGILTKRLNKKI